MRCFYLDSGLRDDAGHHANFARRIVGAMRGRGVETRVFGYTGLAACLQAELHAEKLFRVFTYDTSDGDPISGWLSGFETLTRATIEDLARLPPVEASDLIYVSTVLPIQLMALRAWYARLPESQRPHLVMEFGSFGLAGRRVGDQIQFDLPDPRHEPLPLLFRYIARCHLQPLPPKLHFITFDDATSATFGQLIGCQAQTAPLPYAAVAPLRNRAGAVPIRLACLGHQRSGRGYLMLPDLARTLLGRHRGLEFLVQTIHTGGEPALAATDELRRLASIEKRLILAERAVGGADWVALLDRADLILCPYAPEPYVVSISAMACEAAANAIPLIVPGGTTADLMLYACGGPGLAFERPDIASIGAAIEAVLARYDFYAERAYRAARAWPETRGPDRLADFILGLAG